MCFEKQWWSTECAILCWKMYMYIQCQSSSQVAVYLHVCSDSHEWRRNELFGCCFKYRCCCKEATDSKTRMHHTLGAGSRDDLYNHNVEHVDACSSVWDRLRVSSVSSWKYWSSQSSKVRHIQLISTWRCILQLKHFSLSKRKMKEIFSYLCRTEGKVTKGQNVCSRRRDSPDSNSVFRAPSEEITYIFITVHFASADRTELRFKMTHLQTWYQLGRQHEIANYESGGEKMIAGNFYLQLARGRHLYRPQTLSDRR